jgi:hypothetical protein
VSQPQSDNNPSLILNAEMVSHVFQDNPDPLLGIGKAHDFKHQP